MADTIYALSTPRGRSGVAVIRLSGPGALGAAQIICAREGFTPRHATLCDFVGADGEAIDRGLVLSFPGPKSFTGEDCVELHAHGGTAILAALLERLSALPGLRPAEPGEFARRAFHNDKLDLAEVEGLADLIDAETEAQRKQALRQMDGALSQQVEAWRAELIGALAHLEADIDFPDEDLPEGVAGAVRPRIEALIAEIRRFLADKRGERLRLGLDCAVIGAPNAGKSSFINRLVGRNAVIVSSEPGTTRDVVDLHLDLGGFPLILADTAGLRAAPGAVEQEGVRRAEARAARADLVIVLVDATKPDLSMIAPGHLVLINKADQGADIAALTGQLTGNPHAVLSVKDGSGWDGAISLIEQAARDKADHGTGPVVTRERHRAALAETADALERFCGDIRHAELAAENVRLAVRALGRITGRVDVEDLLDVIFSDFCIGK